MPRVNELGDLEITDPRAMRALAHPVRLTIFERLQRHGPAPVAELAENAGTTPSATGRHLRQLAQHGLVVKSEGIWNAVGSGIRFEPADDDASQAAYRALANQLFLRTDELPRRWLTEDEGQDLLEYVLLGGTIAFAGVLAFDFLSDAMNSTYASWDTAVQSDELVEMPEPTPTPEP